MRPTPATVKSTKTADGLNTAPAWMTVGLPLTVDLDSVQYVSYPTDKPGVLRDRTLIFVTQAPDSDPENFFTIQEFLDIPAIGV